MLLSEKVAYLQGLFEGLEISDTKKEGKVLKGILDVLSDMSEQIESLDYDVEELLQEVENLDTEVDYICEDINTIMSGEDFEDITDYDDYEDGCGDDCDCGDDCGCNDDESDDCGCGCCSDDGDDQSIYEVVCPTCDEEIFFDEETLDDGSMKCHACGEELEFDTTLIDTED